MTDENKTKIMKMRQENDSYKQISKELGISENTVKSFCRRNNITHLKSTTNLALCMQCGKPLRYGSRGQHRKFCTDICRRAWWKANPDKLSKKAYYTITCVGCGIEFKSYGNQDRRFCSHGCFIMYRFTKAGGSCES